MDKITIQKHMRLLDELAGSIKLIKKITNKGLERIIKESKRKYFEKKNPYE